MRKKVKCSLNHGEDKGSDRLIHLLFTQRVVCRKEHRMKAERQKRGPDMRYEEKVHKLESKPCLVNESITVGSITKE